MKLNNKGFTLVEVLTTLAILAILMMVAVPNIIGVINNNKERVFISDAKKMHSIAENIVYTNTDAKPIVNDGCTKIYFSEINNGEFDSTPNGGKYSDESFVLVKRVITNQSDTGDSVIDYEYYVFLKEVYGDSNNMIAGFDVINSEKLYDNDGSGVDIKNGNLNNDISSFSCSVIDEIS